MAVRFLLGADRIVQALERENLRWAFGIPGGPLSGVFHALSVSSKIQVVLTQHETPAAYMAAGAYLFSRPRTVPIVFATSGPGATNVLTGVASAFEEKIPVILITANVAKDLKGKRAAQDSYETGIDTLKMLSPVTADTEVLESVEDIDRMIPHIHRLALERSLPVHMNVPGHIAHQVIPLKTEDVHGTQSVSP